MHLLINKSVPFKDEHLGVGSQDASFHEFVELKRILGSYIPLQNFKTIRGSLSDEA